MKPSDILEGLDPQQKAAGQLGPTETVKNNNIGKLVGANENFINTDAQAVVSEEDLTEHNHLIGVYRKGESQFQLWNEGQYQYKLTSMVGGVPKQYKQWNDFDLEEVKASLIQSGFQSMRTFTDESTKMDKNNLPKQYWNRDTQSIGPTPDAGLRYADPDEDGVHYPDYGNTKFGNTKFKGWRPSVKPQPQPTSVCKRKTDQQYTNQLSNHYAQVYDKIRITFNRRKDIFTITGYNGAETDHIKYTIDPTTCKLRMMSRISVENESINQGLAEASADLRTSAKELARQKAETETYKKDQESKEKVAAKNLKNYQSGNVRANYVKEQGMTEGSDPGQIPSLSRTQYGLLRKLRSAIQYTGQTVPVTQTVKFDQNEKQQLDNLLRLAAPGDAQGVAILKKAASGYAQFDPRQKPIIDKTFNDLLKAPMRDPGLSGQGASYSGPGVGGGMDQDAMAQGFQQAVNKGMSGATTQAAPAAPGQTPPPAPGTMANPIRQPGRFMGPAVMAAPRLKEQGMTEGAGDYMNRGAPMPTTPTTPEQVAQMFQGKTGEQIAKEQFLGRATGDKIAAYVAQGPEGCKIVADYLRKMNNPRRTDAVYLEQGVAEGESNREMWDRVRSKGIVPGIDSEKYTERPGLEGPFHTKTGKVVYYDKQEGKYYDPDTDFYISHDDYQAMNEQGVAEGECPMCVESGTTCKECSMQMESLSQILRNAGIKKV